MGAWLVGNGGSARQAGGLPSALRHPDAWAGTLKVLAECVGAWLAWGASCPPNEAGFLFRIGRTRRVLI
jgi:hypothetical protein